MYRVEATAQLGSGKSALGMIKELPKLENNFKCSFGLAAPWVDRSADYSAKLLLQANFVAIGLTDDSESQTKEMGEAVKALSELNDSKTLKGVTPIASSLLYNHLRKGIIPSHRPAQNCPPVPETPQALDQDQLTADFN